MNIYISLLISSVIVIISACATPYNPLDDMKEITPANMLYSPPPVFNEDIPYSPEQIIRGEYLVGLLGCSSCHTDGALVGTPNYQRHLAGSNTGIAYSNPLKQGNPGVVYPANLTPDADTGIGLISDEALIQQIRMGLNPDGGHTLPVMPWPAYSKLTDDDVDSIVAYLRSLPPIRHRVPNNVQPGQRATAPYVHFGVYQSLR
jgi:mono/diheme cytochrome c family protein